MPCLRLCGSCPKLITLLKSALRPCFRHSFVAPDKPYQRGSNASLNALVTEFMSTLSEGFPRPLIRRLVSPALIALAFATISCSESETDSTTSGDTILSPAPAESAAPGSSATPSPGNTVLMPPTGQITTSANTPSTGERRLLTPEEQARALNLMMNRLAEGQAKGLGDGTVTVHGAWHYDGYSYLAPNPESAIPARMVAVELTVSGHRKEFDPDDIEIVDGLTKISYGSDPHLTLIEGPGKPIADTAKFPVAPAPTRMLLIYAFPRESQSFTLFYWGQELLDEPMSFEASGWGLPFPE